MDTLSREDSLRLNVLLASKPQALRIDESSMTVYGLSDSGEAKVPLHPNCRDELYLRRVRELISGHVLGSPGGYPVYLRRWTRMGQARDESLEQLLLLGEPEAVVAVVHAQGLSNEQARRAWWAMPSAENARCMLERDAVVQGDMGPELARYLVEYLPFEAEPADMILSIRSCLKPDLIDRETRLGLWRRARQKTAYLVGFLMAVPEDLPEQQTERLSPPALQERLKTLAGDGNPFALYLEFLFSGRGQAFLDACDRVLRKPQNQDVVNLLLDTLGEYFAPLRPPEVDPEAELGQVIAESDALIKACLNDSGPEPLKMVLSALPELTTEARALLILSRMGYAVVRPIFSRSTAIGSLMRRKLEPVISPLRRELAVLRSGEAG